MTAILESTTGTHYVGMCVSVCERDACELSQYDCGAAENSRVQVRMPFILEEEWEEGWGGWRCRDLGRVASPWLDLSTPTIKYFLPDHCSTCSINKQIFIIAGQVSGLKGPEREGHWSLPLGTPLIYQALSSFKGWLLIFRRASRHHLLGDHWFLGCGVWNMFSSRSRTVSGCWQRPLESGQGLAQRGRFSGTGA